MKKRNFLRRGIVTFAIAFVLFISAVPAQAATLEDAPVSDTSESELVELGTVVSQQEKEYTVVIDAANLLSTTQVQNIEKKVSELTNYNMALYIENTDPKTCTQKYTNSLSEEKYEEIFGDYRNGVMIVFSFYKAENGYFAVHSGGNVNLSENKVKNLIEGTYHDYKTDATWVEGSFCQCVDYFKEMEKEPIQNTQNEKEPIAKSTVILSLLLFVAIIAIIVLVYEYFQIKSQKTYIEKEWERQRRRASDLEKEKQRLKSKNDSIGARVNKLEKWKKDAKSVRPTIQKDIDVMLSKEAAKGFDSKYAKTVGLPGIVENFDKFDKMMNAYEELNELAKTYVTINISEVSDKRQKTAEKYAEGATNKIKMVCDDCSGTRYERDQLNETVRYYNQLPLIVRLMIAKSLIDSLNSKKDSSESDYRRHQSSYNSNHSSYGHTTGGSFSHTHTFGGGFGGGH